MMSPPRESWCSVWRKPTGELGLRVHAPWMEDNDWAWLDDTEASLFRREMTLAVRRLRRTTKASRSRAMPGGG